MRLTEVLKEGKKLVSELVSELDEVELAFYQHNPADIDQITIRVIDEVVPKKADELLRLTKLKVQSSLSRSLSLFTS